MNRTVLALATMIATGGCAGVPAGSPELGYVVWGYVGQGTTSAVSGTTVSLVDASGRTVQSETTDWAGKYTFAYHQPGDYEIVVGELRMPVVVADGDQRLDIDLSRADGQMSYLRGAVENAVRDMGPPTCSDEPQANTAEPGAAPVERDPNLVGSWSRTDSFSSGDASMATRLTLLICADGSYVRTVGETVGGGAGWSAESRGAESTRGQWRSEGGVVYIRSAMGGWEPYAQYYVEGPRLMLTFEGGQREVWTR